MKKSRLKTISLAIVFFLAALAAGYYALFSNKRDARVPPKGTLVQGFSSPRDLLAFLDANGSRLSAPEMDAAILKLLALQQSRQKPIEKQMFSDELNAAINQYSVADLTDLRNVKEDAVLELIRSVLGDGFRLSSSEGMIYPEIDFPGILARFGPQATEPMNTYLAIMARETERHFGKDAALTIGLDELGERLAAIEKFVGSNPRFPRIEEVGRLEAYYLSAFLLGLNNTPAFSYETGRLNEPFLKSYRSALQRFPGTRLAEQVSNYLDVLEKNEFRKTEEVLDFVRNTAPQS